MIYTHRVRGKGDRVMLVSFRAAPFLGSRRLPLGEQSPWTPSISMVILINGKGEGDVQDAAGACTFAKRQ